MKKVYIHPVSMIFSSSPFMEGGQGPVQNTGNGYNFGSDPVGGDDLEGKGTSWEDEDDEENDGWVFDLKPIRNKLWD